MGFFLIFKNPASKFNFLLCTILQHLYLNELIQRKFSKTLKVKLPREYIKLSPISSAIIPHRTPDGQLAKTGYVKLLAFSQVLCVFLQLLKALFGSRGKISTHNPTGPKWWYLNVYHFTNFIILYDRQLPVIWKKRFTSWRIRVFNHTYWIFETIQ